MATAPHTFKSLPEISPEVADWVASVASTTQADRIHWCDGSAAETAGLREELIARRELQPLNAQDLPRLLPGPLASQRRGARRTPDVHLHQPPGRRRPEQQLDGAGRSARQDGRAVRRLHEGPHAVRRALLHGPHRFALLALRRRDHRQRLRRAQHGHHDAHGSPGARAHRADGGKFVRGLHSIGELDPDRRFIMHFPEELSIQSFGSGYGGNALLGKKCHALRIASYQARTEGWLAEHMLIVGLKNPQGELHYVACAFPSACGKTNLAMLIPPDSMPGWEVFTVGDDICWLQPGPDGRLWAINPESGYFGVAPGTGTKTNRNAFDMIRRDTLFTNVALTAATSPGGKASARAQPAIDWQGRPYDPKNGPAAHPNSRFTVSAVHNPAYTKEAENPRGVPISAIVFGGRRRELAPLVYEARNWQHGVLVGASVASETTAAATGAVGVVRRDPMAMKPFCGYNFGDYLAHWLNVGAKLKSPPQIFHVNWFRQDADGKFLWPGFGDNLRVLSWMLERCAGRADANDTAIGYLPRPQDLNVKGLDINPEVLQELLSVKTGCVAQGTQGHPHLP